MKTGLLRTQSIVLAMALLITTVLFDVNRSQIRAETAAETGVVVPSVNKDCIVSAVDVSSWWSTAMTLSDDEQGGIRYEWKDSHKGRRQGVLDTFSLDDMRITLDKLSCSGENTGDTFAIALSNNPYYMDGNSPTTSDGITYSLYLVFDIDKGEISVANDALSNGKFTTNGTVLLRNDLLKYKNISGRQFAISFTDGENGAFNINVEVDGETVKAENALTAEMIAKANGLYNTDYLYVALTSWNSIGISVIYRSVGEYRVQETGLAVPSTDKLIKNIQHTTWWPNNLQVTDADCGGLHYVFTDTDFQRRQGISSQFKLDGLYLLFDRLNPRTHVLPSLAITFTDNAWADYNEDGMLAFLINTKDGAIYQVTSKDFKTRTLVVQDDKIKQLIGRPFTLNAAKQQDGTYKLTVKTDTFEVAGNLDLTKATAFNPDSNYYVAIAPGYASDEAVKPNFTVDYLGIGNCSTTVADVEAVINAIGEVTLESAPIIRYARDLFSQLSMLKLETLVSNAETLYAAEKKFTTLAKAADEELTKLTLSNARHSGSSNSSIQNTLKEWEGRMKLTELENGGLHFDFASAICGIREGFSENVSLDGLYVQFDNLKAATAESQSLAFIVGNSDSAYAPEPAGSLVFVLDAVNGKIIAQPSGEIVMESEHLKYENIQGRRFSYEFSQNDDGIWEMYVCVNNEKLEAALTENVMIEATGLSDTSSCNIAITSWNRDSTYSVDLIGFKKTKLSAADVIALIDDIGMLNSDSIASIEKAMVAYDTLSPTEKAGVYNYDQLTSYQLYAKNYSYESMIKNAQELIDEIGTVTFRSGDALDKAGIAVDRLNEEQRSELKNLNTYYNSLKKYNELTASMLQIETYASGFSTASNRLRFANDQISTWVGKMTTQIAEDTSLHIEFKDAIRDMRNGPINKYALDGLYVRFANLTVEEGKDGTRLSVQINSDEANYTKTPASMAFVFDTFNGTLTAYPTNRIMIKSDLLKQSNIDGKEISMRFMLLEEGVYRLVLRIGNETLSAAVPSSMLFYPGYSINTGAVRVMLSPWVNNETGLEDISEHTFSVDLLSVQSNKHNAFEDVYGLIERINELPSKISEEDVSNVLEINSEYSSLARVIKAMITNYNKLGTALNQVYELSQDDYLRWDS